jgi:serine/threonine protein kinase
MACSCRVLTVDAVHSVPVVHGDLTPVRQVISGPFLGISSPFSQNNVLLNNEQRAVLMDFGLSSMLLGQGYTYLQRSQAQPGAIRYTAPELLDPDAFVPPDTRSDVYSFGCLALHVGFQCPRSCLCIDCSL